MVRQAHQPDGLVAEPVEAPVLVVRQAHQLDGLVAELVEAPVLVIRQAHQPDGSVAELVEAPGGGRNVRNSKKNAYIRQVLRLNKSRYES